MNMALAADGGGGGYWQLALILAGIGFLGLFARWRKARTPPVPRASELRARDENPNRYRDAADKAIVELLETSRVLNAQIDTKIRVLNRLVKDAEDRTAALEKALARAEALASGGTAPAPAPAVAETREPPAAPAGEEAPEAGCETAPAERFLSDLHETIHRLREEGKSVADIARVTKLSTTEVEFIVKTL